MTFGTSRGRAALTCMLLLAALLVVGCGSDSGDAEPATTDETTTRETTAETEQGVECSATESPELLEDEPGLPAPVAETRRKILTAASACDFDELDELAGESGGQFAFTFGDDQGEGPGAYWREIDGEDRVLARMTQLLTTPHAVSTEGGKTYVWPAVHAGNATDEQWQALTESEAYSAKEVAAFRADDMYYGYRVGILPDGAWTYFIAGD
ncbi:MAG: hypothetical protein JWM25_152 [Thermoleophilia bacterium]|nr:hypothetical protein [Thermoleophilia bacterium]MCZ4495569.1 hypothetical protein [Thermoleophilia bacterium]